MALQFLIVWWAGLRLSGLTARGEARPFAIVFWVYVYVWMGLAGLVQLAHGEAPHALALSSDSYWTAQLIVLLGLAALEIGCLLTPRLPAAWTRRELVYGRITVLAAIVIAAAPFWYVQLGGLSTLFSSREQLTNTILGGTAGTEVANLAVGGIRISLATVPAFLALYAVLVTNRYPGWPRRSRWLIAPLILVAGVLNSPIVMSRFWTATIATALIFAVPVVQRRALAVRAIVVAALLASIVLFQYGAYFRYASGFRQTDGVVHTLSTFPDYDSFEMIAAGVEYTHDAEFKYGEQALTDVLFFVPRSVWSGKSQNTGELVGETYHLPNTNLSAPLWIESYIDFGYIGVIVVFFLFGLIMRQGDDLFVSRVSPFGLFAIPLIAGYCGILLRGSLLQAMGRLSVMLVILYLISRPKKSQRATPP